MTRRDQERRDLQIALERATTKAGVVAERRGVDPRTVRRAVQRAKKRFGSDGTIGIELLAARQARLASAIEDLALIRERTDDPKLVIEAVKLQTELMSQQLRLDLNLQALGIGQTGHFWA